VLVLLVVGLLVGAGAGAGYGIGRAVDMVRSAWPEPTPVLEAAKEAPPTPLDPAGPANTCDPSMVSLDLGSPTAGFTLGDSIPFTMRVTNVGRVPCLLDGHRSSMQVTVTAADGDKQLWSSADCAGTGEELLLLGPDEVWEATARWTGSRSAPGCGGSGKVPGGEYAATLTLPDVGASSDPFEVTVAAAPEPEPEPESKNEGEADGGSDKSSDKSSEKKSDEQSDESSDQPAEDAEESSGDKKSSDEKNSSSDKKSSRGQDEGGGDKGPAKDSSGA